MESILPNMKISGEFISLATLVPSLESNRRLYFLYLQSAKSGHPGAGLRFQWFKRRLPKDDLSQLEIIFESRSLAGRHA